MNMNNQTFPSAPEWLKPPPQDFLNEEEIARLDAIFNRILPADPKRHIPGATQAGASLFLNRLLAMPPEIYYEIEGWRLLYPLALKALEQFCRQSHGQKMAEIDDAKMDALIAGLEQGQIAELSIAAALAELDETQLGRIKELIFRGRLTALSLKNNQIELNQQILFKTLLRHCLQGCFADPRWGGNKDKIMWRAFGYLQPAEDISV
jgi:gluconate 2-dehydrogenase gamma chain